MAISTYSELRTAVSNYLGRSDLVGSVPDFIAMGEERIFQDLRVREMEDRQQATMSTSSRYLALPTGYIEMRRLHFTDDSGYVYDLSFVTPEQLNDRINLQAGKPLLFTTIGSEMEFDRVPDDTYTVQMSFYKELTALSDSNTTNDILTKYPSVYLYASLISAEGFLGPDERIPGWYQMYETAVKRANKTDKKGRFSGSTLRMRSDVYPV